MSQVIGSNQVTQAANRLNEASADEAGRSPETPFYVDMGTNLVAEPALFPANTYLTREEMRTFEGLLQSMNFAIGVIAENVSAAKSRANEAMVRLFPPCSVQNANQFTATDCLASAKGRKLPSHQARRLHQGKSANMHSSNSPTDRLYQ